MRKVRLTRAARVARNLDERGLSAHVLGAEGEANMSGEVRSMDDWIDVRFGYSAKLGMRRGTGAPSGALSILRDIYAFEGGEFIANFATPR